MCQTTDCHEEEIDATADALARGILSPLEAEQAWRCLQNAVILPMIQRFEEELHCDSLGEVADECLPRRLAGYRRDKGRFANWLYRTLFNLVRDERRSTRRRATFEMDDPGQVPDKRQKQAEEPTLSVEQRLAQSLQNLRETLTELAERPRARQQKTDYHAVLLLELRLAMAARLRGHREALTAAGQDRAQLSERHLPWLPSEQTCQIQPGWPKLLVIWQLLAEELLREDDLMTDDDIVLLLSPQPGVQGLTPVAWRQWRTRAIQAAVEFLGTERWDRTVARWL